MKSKKINPNNRNIVPGVGIDNNLFVKSGDFNLVIDDLQSLASGGFYTSTEPLSLTASTTRVISGYTTSALDTGGISSLTISQTQTAASTANQIEVGQFVLTSNVKTGQWANALLAKIDYSTSGYATGLAGVVCAELDMPAGTVTGGSGTYTLFEAELNMPTGFVGGGVPVSIFNINVWGAQAAQFDTSGFLFDITGVTKASGKFFQDNTAAAASQAIKCRINGTAYYIMLTSTGA